MIRLLVTRPRAEAASLAEALREAGFDPICVPTVAIEPPADDSLQRALEQIETFDWLIVTSANAVGPLVGRIPASVRVAAVGATTADALRRAGIRVDHVPDEYRSAAIAHGLGELQDRRVLLARADVATADLSRALVDRGAMITEAIAYRTIAGPPASTQPLREALATRIDGLVFTSASAVRGLLSLLDPAGQSRAFAIPAMCIGPVTAAAAREAGFMVTVVAAEHTGIGLARTIAEQRSTSAMA